MNGENGSFALYGAAQTAKILVTQLALTCHHIEVAGSIRREKAYVHDIDLVAWPIREVVHTPSLFGQDETVIGGPDKLAAAIQQLTKGVVHSTADSRILHFTYNGIPVEIYLAEPDGNNFEALLQLRTGSEAHNRMLAGRAQYLKLYYHAGYGIYKMGPDRRYSVRVDDGTEQGVYKALQVQYLEPRQRA